MSAMRPDLCCLTYELISKFDLKKKKYVGLDMGLFEKIKNKAKKLHISEDMLIQEWLMEKV
jgi:hypothetical protein